MFLNNDKAVYQHVIPLFLQRLHMVLDWMLKQRQFVFYASSLLLVYEGAMCRCSRDSRENRTTAITEDATWTDSAKHDGTGCDATDATVAHHVWECSKHHLVMEGETNDQYADVRMIDFAHVFPSGDKDNNYIEGVESLVKYLNRLL